jgi:hypothetical protein
VRTRQVVLGFQKPVDIATLVKLIEAAYGKGSVTLGQGQAVNGIPNDWIVVHNERPVK